MFLHALRAVIVHPVTGAELELEAPLPPELAAFLAGLDAGEPSRAQEF
jgi:23S rRNA pseudouridine955/2504/2580 synthase